MYWVEDKILQWPHLNFRFSVLLSAFSMTSFVSKKCYSKVTTFRVGESPISSKGFVSIVYLLCKTKKTVHRLLVSISPKKMQGSTARTQHRRFINKFMQKFEQYKRWLLQKINCGNWFRRREYTENVSISKIWTFLIYSLSTLTRLRPSFNPPSTKLVPLSFLLALQFALSS